MTTIFWLGSTNPAVDPGLTAVCVLLVAFCSASQDIVVDAYRVEILDERQYGAGAAVIVLGYRIGMLVSGAGALYLASFFGWFAAYGFMAAFVSVGVGTILLSAEPKQQRSRESIELERKLSDFITTRTHLLGKRADLIAWIYGTVINPFAEFMSRRGWIIILSFIVLYKFGDALAGVMTNPFLVELGFSKIDIANISKAFGLAATIIGGIIGGVMVNRLGIMKSLLLCGLLQMFSNLIFLIQAVVGYNRGVLALTISVENLSGGMGTAAFVAYLSSLCNVAYTATQYALLSSLMAFGRTLLSSSGGWLADHMGWISFFFTTTLAALPGLVMLVWMTRRFGTGGVAMTTMDTGGYGTGQSASPRATSDPVSTRGSDDPGEVDG
jgi:PAT family beta-lactamase induction signal transducer AmpG